MPIAAVIAISVILWLLFGLWAFGIYKGYWVARYVHDFNYALRGWSLKYDFLGSWLFFFGVFGWALVICMSLENIGEIVFCLRMPKGMLWYHWGLKARR